jgi:hypothetical protein
MLGWLRAAVLAALVSFVAGQSLQNGLLTFLYTAAPRYEPAAWNQGGERFPEGARLVLMTAGTRRDVAPGFFASADASVSFDGRRVLFSGKASRQDRWQIWETDLAGGSPRQLSAASDTCLRPLYLPGGGIVYTRVTQTGSQIEVLPAEGSPVDVLTHAPGWYLTDDVLRDGRILFEWAGELFTVYPDGTGVESLRCDHGPRRSGGRQLSSGDVIFGVDRGMARFTSALTVQQKVPGAGLDLLPPLAELDSDHWLLSARPPSGGWYRIQRGGPVSKRFEVVESLPAAHAVDPVVVAARVPPREFPSALAPGRTTGNLLCLDAREAKPAIDGKIHAVRLYTRDDSGESQALGQTAVASDGSFYVEVPADRPIRMELLDPAGSRLRGEEHWFWMRPGEQRICVGCHAGPERAPENKVPEILNQMLKPVKMLGESRGTR